MDRDETGQEVLDVRAISVERASALPAVWAQVSGVRARLGTEVTRDLLVGQRYARLAAGAPQLPPTHQAPGQAMQAQAREQRVCTAASYETKGGNGFRGHDAAAKRIVDGVSGVPPRGRPV